MSIIQPKTSSGIEEANDRPAEFSAAEIGAIAHLYRGEVYRSTAWRTRLDNTTNWAIVTTGLALSITFSNNESSPLPMILVGLLITAFLFFEARRYRYFNVWRARARLIETEFYVPLLRRQGHQHDPAWAELLANDYCKPEYHISFIRAVGRRLRQNYIWVISVQAVAYYGKLLIHPTPLENYQQLFERATVGPIHGEWIILCGIIFHTLWLVVAYVTWRQDMLDRKRRNSDVAMG